MVRFGKVAAKGRIFWCAEGGHLMGHSCYTKSRSIKQKWIHRQDAKSAKSLFVSCIGSADTEKKASMCQLRGGNSGDLATASRSGVIRAGSPEFAGY